MGVRRRVPIGAGPHHVHREGALMQGGVCGFRRRILLEVRFIAAARHGRRRSRWWLDNRQILPGEGPMRRIRCPIEVGTAHSQGRSSVLTGYARLALIPLHFAGLLCDRAYVIEKGQVRYEGTMAELVRDERLKREYLSV
jgi:hypothetical protein